MLRRPTEIQYKQMVLDKTGGLFRLAIGLMKCFNPQVLQPGGAVVYFQICVLLYIYILLLRCIIDIYIHVCGSCVMSTYV